MIVDVEPILITRKCSGIKYEDECYNYSIVARIIGQDGAEDLYLCSRCWEHWKVLDYAQDQSELPRMKPYPSKAVQCDECGGHGWNFENNKICLVCGGNGWVNADHPRGRVCHAGDCNNKIPPWQLAVYCSTRCALRDV